MSALARALALSALVLGAGACPAPEPALEPHLAHDCLCQCYVCEQHDPAGSECLAYSADRRPFPTSACVPEGTDPLEACVDDCALLGTDCLVDLLGTEPVECPSRP